MCLSFCNHHKEASCYLFLELGEAEKKSKASLVSLLFHQLKYIQFLVWQLRFWHLRRIIQTDLGRCRFDGMYCDEGCEWCQIRV